MAEATLRAGIDFANFRVNADDKTADREDKRVAETLLPGETREIPDSEHKRLAGLGVLAGEDADENLLARGIAMPTVARATHMAAQPVVNKPNMKPNTEPTDTGTVGTPLDAEIAADERVEGDTSALALNALKLKDGTLHAEAGRLGIKVDDQMQREEILGRIREERLAQADRATAKSDDE